MGLKNKCNTNIDIYGEWPIINQRHTFRNWKWWGGQHLARKLLDFGRSDLVNDTCFFFFLSV